MLLQVQPACGHRAAARQDSQEKGILVQSLLAASTEGMARGHGVRAWRAGMFYMDCEVSNHLD